MITDSIIRGSGAGQPLGILNAGSLITVDKEAGQDADTLVTENLVNMWARLLPRSKQNAVWLINPSIEPQLYQLALSVGTGGLPVFLPAGGMSATPYMSLLGRPVIPCESCSTLGDLGDIILADLGAGYVLAEKAGGAKFAQSIAVRFVYDELAFRLTYRFDGAPMLASAITPAQGVDTMSHFVRWRHARRA
jgi:HK97 family phage major capsid protein